VLHPNLVLSTDHNAAPSPDGTIDVDAMIKHFSEDNDEQSGKNAYAEGVLVGLGEDNLVECPICLDVMEERMIIPECMHQWYVHSCWTYPIFLKESCNSCKDCIFSFLAACDERREPGRCPTCSRSGLKVRINKIS